MKKITGILFFLIPMMINAQWVQTNGPGVGSVFKIVKNGTLIFAGTSNLYSTSNNGDNWTKIPVANFDPQIQSIVISDSLILCGAGHYGIYRSTNYGITWSNISLSSNEDFILSAAISPPCVYFGSGPGWNECVWRSTNYGLNFSLMNETVHERVFSLIANGPIVYSGSYFNGVSRSTNYGVNWTRLLFPGTFSLIIQESKFIAGTVGAGIYVSNDSGQTWLQTLPMSSNRWVYALASNETFIFAGNDSDGVYLSVNGGYNWVQVNEGLTNRDILSLKVTNDYLFAGMWNEGYVWRRPLSDFVGLKNEKTIVPSSYHLYQNYPNPFNPSTKIKFSLPRPSEGGELVVQLNVYDVLGRKIVSLIPPLLGGQEGLAPGTYEVEWNGSNYPSGVYYYKLTAPEFTETKKMVLVK
ncbi:MAG: T9SS type A sorting domain-containing protein [Ignavibacteria bacterium]